jgi:uncharacterized protein (DUF1786 family)
MALWTAFAAPAEAEPVMSDRIAALSDINQRMALAGMFNGTGKTCRVVRRAFYQGKDVNGVGYFNVSCEIDAARTMEEYVLVMQNGEKGGVRVMDCQRARMLSKTACWEKIAAGR